MNGELMQINNQINELKLKKIEISEKIKETQKDKKQYNNSSSVLKRISSKLDSKIDEVNEKREENGFGMLSKPKITELIVRHKLFPQIEKDLINFDPKLEEGEI